MAKTLKNLDESGKDTEAFSHHAHLKMEAIEWIKQLNQEMKTLDVREGRIASWHEFDASKICGAKDFIIKFFNLEKKDVYNKI